MLGLILLANAVVIGLAVARVITWPYVAVPAGLLVAWLVACRVMVKGERAAARPARAAASVETTDELPETVDSPMVPEVEALDVEDGRGRRSAGRRAEGAAPDSRRGRVGHGAHHLADLRLEGGRRAAYGPDDRPRLHRRLVLGSQATSDSVLAREAEESERGARPSASRRARRASGS